MLLNPLDGLLGTKTKVCLLRALVPLDRPVSGREAARLAGVSRNALGALDELSSAGILNRGETTGQHLFTFNRRHQLAPTIDRLFDAEQHFTSTIFSRISDVVGVVESVESAQIFGSSARGEAGPESDLDLLVVVRGQKARDRVHSALVHLAPGLSSEFGVHLSPVVITLDKFRLQIEENDPFVSEVQRDARHVIGRTIEELIDG